MTEEVNIAVLGDLNWETVFVPVSYDHVDQDERATFGLEQSAQWQRIHFLGGAWQLEHMIKSALEFALSCNDETPESEEVPSGDSKSGDSRSQDTEEDDVIVSGKYKFKVFGVPMVSDEAKGGPRQSVLPEYAVAVRPYPVSTRDEETSVYRIHRRIGWIESGYLSGQAQGKRVEVIDWKSRRIELIENLKKRMKQAISIIQQRKIKPDLVVLNDRNNGFRSAADDKSLDELLESKPHLIWQRSGPLGQLESESDPIWKIVSKHELWSNTIFVCNHECLRDAGINVRFDSSFETMLTALLTQSENHPLLKQLMQFRHLVVRFDVGVLHIQRKEKMPSQFETIDVHFRNFAIDERDARIWGAIDGSTLLLVSTLAHEIARMKSEGIDPMVDIERALDWSVYLGLLHFRRGYGLWERRRSYHWKDPYQEIFRIAESRRDRDAEQQLTVQYPNDPKRLVFKERLEDEFRIARLVIPKSLLEKRKVEEGLLKWSRVELLDDDPIELSKLCRIMVRRGLRSVMISEHAYDISGKPTGYWEPSIKCPYGEFGKITTCDCEELDRFFNIKYLMEKYLQKAEWEKPLSIAVFGPPGSGKNFTIKQIVRSVSREAAESTKVFNLSHFDKLEDLWRALQQVRDMALTGATPLVIFDEFDTRYKSNELGWLGHFLAPMQDGQFYDGQALYRIGKAIFVFAGGISQTFSSFSELASQKVAEKAPDFVSRLRGHLDIKSISTDSDKVSNGLQFRRAILLRSLLKTHHAEIFDDSTKLARIDDGILNAFLKVKAFKHGVRSMEAILDMSRSSDNHRFQKSSLPSADQLEMHVSQQEFINLVNELA